MARITYVKSARKRRGGKPPYRCAQCGHEIQEGESYKWFANRIGRSSYRKNYCSQHSPRPSDMTTSDKLSQLYAAQEAVEDAGSERDDIAQALRDAADTAESVGEEYTESADNIEEGFGHETYQSEEIREKAESCEEWSQVLNDAADEAESLEASDVEQDIDDELEEGDEGYEEAIKEAIDARAREIADNAIYELQL